MRSITEPKITVLDGPEKSLSPVRFFCVIRRPPVSRRQLHLLQFAKGGKRRAYGGTTTRHNVRKGDLVKATMSARTVIGWVSGDTQRQVSVSDVNWKRLGQFTASKVELLKRSTGLVVNRSLASLIPPHLKKMGYLRRKR